MGFDAAYPAVSSMVKLSNELSTAAGVGKQNSNQFWSTYQRLEKEITNEKGKKILQTKIGDYVRGLEGKIMSMSNELERIQRAYNSQSIKHYTKRDRSINKKAEELIIAEGYFPFGGDACDDRGREKLWVTLTKNNGDVHGVQSRGCAWGTKQGGLLCSMPYHQRKIKDGRI